MNSSISLAKAYEKYFKIGAAVSPRYLETYDSLLKTHFNSLTCENQMKYAVVEPEEGKFEFEEADKVIAFAREMGVKLRAHAPVWHNQTGAWMYKDGDKPAPKELIYERIDAHTKAIAEHFNDDVYCWDVVNEATFDEDLGQVDDSVVYRNSEYYKLCGPEFLVKAFQSMDKYSPNAQLFYNDYNEFEPRKRKRIVALLKYLQENGCRLDGFGLQQHFNSMPDYDEVKRSIEEYASLGLRLHVTELDVSMMAVAGLKRRAKPGTPEYAQFVKACLHPTPEQIAMIDTIYEELFKIYRSYSDVIDCVTTWGVADDYTWLDSFGSDPNLPGVKHYPLLFDVDHNPKPCVLNMIDACL